MGCLITTSFNYCQPYSAGGIRRILIGNYTQINDFYFNQTGDTEQSIVTALSTANTYTGFYEYSFDKTQTSFTDSLNKSENGKLYTKELSVIFTEMSWDKRTSLQQILNSKMIVLMLDYNSNWWIMGEDQSAKAIEYEGRSSSTEGSNEYSVVIRSVGKYPIRRINNTYVNTTLAGTFVNTGGGGTQPVDPNDPT